MLTLTTCRTLADFETVEPLLAEMGAWDAREAAAYGIPEADTIAAYYSDTAAGLLERHTAPRTGFYLARWNGEAAGCMGFSRWSDEIAQVKKFYVRPALRRKAIGRALVFTAITGIRRAGYREACLVTTRFMPQAVALYARAGFEACEPFEALPEAFAPFTLFMRQRL